MQNIISKNLFNIIIELDRMVGSKLFSFPYGLFEKIFGEIRLLLNSFSAKKDFLKKYENCYRNGFMKLYSVVDKNYLHSLRKTLRLAIKKNDPNLSIIREGNHILSQALRFKEGDKTFEEFKFVFKKTEIANLLHGVLKGDFRILELIIWRNYHLPQKFRINHPDYYSATWHTDGCPIDIAKVFINLQDVSIEHGPTYIASKKDSKNIIRLGYKKRTNYSKAENMIKKLESNANNIMIGKAGDGFYFNPACCMHRAGIPEVGNYRDMLMLIAKSEIVKKSY